MTHIPGIMLLFILGTMTGIMDGDGDGIHGFGLPTIIIHIGTIMDGITIIGIHTIHTIIADHAVDIMLLAGLLIQEEEVMHIQQEIVMCQEGTLLQEEMVLSGQKLLEELGLEQVILVEEAPLLEEGMV